MSITRLITHGCSFTYGEELPNPSTQAWPALVANALNVQCCNKGLPSYSNDGVIEDLVNTDIDPNSDLIIVMWTQPHRIQIIDDQGWFVCFPNNSDEEYHRNTISKMLMAHANQQWLYNRWLTQVILLQQYFKSRNIQYLFVNAFDNNEYIKATTLHNQIDTTYFLGWPEFNFNTLTDNNYGKLSFGHPNADAHQAIANTVLTYLKELYDL